MTDKEKIEALEKVRDAAVALFKAEDAYGCGFYNDEDWCRRNTELRELLGFSSRFNLDF